MEIKVNTFLENKTQNTPHPKKHRLHKYPAYHGKIFVFLYFYPIFTGNKNKPSEKLPKGNKKSERSNARSLRSFGQISIALQIYIT